MKRRPSSGIWPASRWDELLRQAIRVLATVPAIEWTFGGGSALALVFRHRISYDVDIFLQDAQLLASLSPRLNDVASQISDEYAEQSNFLKIRKPYGEMDFVLAPDVTPQPAALRLVAEVGREMMVQRPAEILAKKIKFRGYKFTLRDMFDLAVMLERDASSVDLAFAACQGGALEAALDVMRRRLPTLSADLPEYVNPTPAFAGMVARAPKLIAGYIG